MRGLAVGGAGVGEVVSQLDGGRELLGITAFVPRTAPGERVRARVLETKPRFLKGELLEVETAAEDRVDAPCPHYGQCGGCELQHIGYDTQLKLKYEMICGMLAAYKLPSRVMQAVLPLVPSPPFGYRRRVVLHVDAQGKVGFYREGTRSVVPITSCAIATSEISAAISKLPEITRKLKGCISSIVLEEDMLGVVAVFKSPYDLGPGEKREVLESAKDVFQNVVLVSDNREIGGFGRQLLELPLNHGKTLSLQIPPALFTQVNWEINLELIDCVVRKSEAYKQNIIYDLYAGGGNFTLPLAKAGAQVVSVEAEKRLTYFARESAEKHAISKRIEFVDSSVERFLDKDTRKHSASTVVADPPRNGLGALCERLDFAKRLILISCHLPSFVRDVKSLTARGWEVTTIQPFDMFPQTSYVEVMTVMEK